MPHRLQPALLDRLTDLEPGATTEADDQRVMNRTQMRAAVLRDLTWLLNTVQAFDAEAEAEAWPQAADSVLGYGLPAMAGEVISRVDLGGLEQAIRRAILRFEPRVLPEGLQVKAIEVASLSESHNVIELEIRGALWAQPAPQALHLRTRIDLEAGHVDLREVGTAAPSRSA